MYANTLTCWKRLIVLDEKLSKMLMNACTIESYGAGFLAGMAKAVESVKNCIQCGECEERCPFQLPIREMIVENVEFYERAAVGRTEKPRSCDLPRRSKPGFPNSLSERD